MVINDNKHNIRIINMDKVLFLEIAKDYSGTIRVHHKHDDKPDVTSLTIFSAENAEYGFCNSDDWIKMNKLTGKEYKEEK